VGLVKSTMGSAASLACGPQSSIAVRMLATRSAHKGGVEQKSFQGHAKISDAEGKATSSERSKLTCSSSASRFSTGDGPTAPKMTKRVPPMVGADVDSCLKHSQPTYSSSAKHASARGVHATEPGKLSPCEVSDLLRPLNGGTSIDARRVVSRPSSAPSAFGKRGDFDSNARDVMEGLKTRSDLPKRPSSAPTARTAQARGVSAIPDYCSRLPSYADERIARRHGLVKLEDGNYSRIALERPPVCVSPAAASRRAARRDQSRKLCERRPRSNMYRRRYMACCS